MPEPQRDSVCRLDQVFCDSDCYAGHHLSGFDNRPRDVRVALGSVNRLTGRFAAICSTFKPNARTIPDLSRNACTKGDTRSDPDPDAATESSPYTSPQASAPPPIASTPHCSALTLQWQSAGDSRLPTCRVFWQTSLYGARNRRHL